MLGKRYILLSLLAVVLASGVIIFRLVNSPEPTDVGIMAMSVVLAVGRLMNLITTTILFSLLMQS
jgi:hypothetical protein